MKVSFRPDLIRSGCQGSKHQLTNSVDHDVTRPHLKVPWRMVLERLSPVTCDMPKPCEFPSADSCQKRFLLANKEVDHVPHPCAAVGLVLQVEDGEKFPQAPDLESLDPFLRVSNYQGPRLLTPDLAQHMNIKHTNVRARARALTHWKKRRRKEGRKEGNKEGNSEEAGEAAWWLKARDTEKRKKKSEGRLRRRRRATMTIIQEKEQQQKINNDTQKNKYNN